MEIFNFWKPVTVDDKIMFYCVHKYDEDYEIILGDFNKGVCFTERLSLGAVVERYKNLNQQSNSNTEYFYKLFFNHTPNSAHMGFRDLKNNKSILVPFMILRFTYKIANNEIFFEWHLKALLKINHQEKILKPTLLIVNKLCKEVENLSYELSKRDFVLDRHRNGDLEADVEAFNFSTFNKNQSEVRYSADTLLDLYSYILQPEYYEKNYAKTPIFGTGSEINIVDTVEPVDTIEIANTLDTVDQDDKVDVVDTLDTLNTVHTVDTIHTVHSVNTNSIVDTVQTIPTVDTINTVDADYNTKYDTEYDMPTLLHDQKSSTSITEKQIGTIMDDKCESAWEDISEQGEANIQSIQSSGQPGDQLRTGCIQSESFPALNCTSLNDNNYEQYQEEELKPDRQCDQSANLSMEQDELQSVQERPPHVSLTSNSNLKLHLNTGARSSFIQSDSISELNYLSLNKNDYVQNQEEELNPGRQCNQSASLSMSIEQNESQSVQESPHGSQNSNSNLKLHPNTGARSSFVQSDSISELNYLSLNNNGYEQNRGEQLNPGRQSNQSESLSIKSIEQDESQSVQERPQRSLVSDSNSALYFSTDSGSSALSHGNKIEQYGTRISESGSSWCNRSLLSYTERESSSTLKIIGEHKKIHFKKHESIVQSDSQQISEKTSQDDQTACCCNCLLRKRYEGSQSILSASDSSYRYHEASLSKDDSLLFEVCLKHYIKYYEHLSSEVYERVKIFVCNICPEKHFSFKLKGR